MTIEFSSSKNSLSTDTLSHSLLWPGLGVHLNCSRWKARGMGEGMRTPFQGADPKTQPGSSSTSNPLHTSTLVL